MAGTPLANVFLTSAATGLREDLTDIISNISPTDTPFYNSMGTAGAQGVYTEWQTQALAAAAINANTEGAIFAAGSVTPTDRLGNRHQIMTKEFTISDTTELVSKAGRPKEGAYQMVKAAKELARDMELACFTSASGSSGATGNQTTPFRMRNAFWWISAVTTTTGASGTYGSIATALTGDTITEAQFNDIGQDIYDNGGTPNAVYVPGALKRLITGWGTSTSRPHPMEGGDTTITNTVDIYKSDFGTYEIKKERHCASSLGFFIDESLWKKAILKPVGWKELAARGLGKDYMLWTQWTILAMNPSGNGLFISAP